MAATQWYYRCGEQERGPVSAAMLSELASAGRITPESLIRKGTDGTWASASRIRGLVFSTDAVLQETTAGTARQATESVAPARDELSDARDVVRELVADKATRRAVRRWRKVSAGIAGAIVTALLTACVVIYWPTSAPMASRESEDHGVEDEIGRLRKELADIRRQQEADRRRAVNEEREQASESVAPGTAEGPASGRKSASLPTIATEDDSPRKETAITPGELPSQTKNVAEVVAKVRQSLVFIEAGMTKSSGSGFVADASGLIVTNRHVVDGAQKVAVTFSDGERAEVTMWLAANSGTDLVLLDARGRGHKLVALPLAAATPETGVDVLAIGAPLGQRETVTRGIVSAIRKGRELPGGQDIDANSTWIQTSAQIAQGNSGGPLFDVSGRLVGVNSSFLVVDSNVGNVPFNYAVSVDEVRKLLASASPSGQPLASLPRLRRVRNERPAPDESREIAEAVAAAQAAHEKRRLDALQRVYEQRLVIFNNWENTRNRAVQLDGQLKAVQVAYARADAATTAAKKNGAAIRLQAQRLENDLLYTRDPAAADRIRVRLQLLEAEFRAYEDKFRQAEAERNEAYEVGRDLQTKLQVENGEMERLRREADQLESEWLTLMDPWGHMTRGAHERVVELASQWIVLHEKNPLPYLVRADAYVNLGRFNQAITDLNKAAALSPNSAGPLACRGWAFSTAGDFRRALADFGKALQIDRANARVYLFKAQTLAKKKDFSSAVKDYEVAMNLAPSDPEVLRAYAFFMATCSNDGYRKGKKAVEYARKSCELTNWANWSCLDVLAAACAESGDFASAEKWGVKALELSPEQTRPLLRERLSLYESKRAVRIP